MKWTRLDYKVPEMGRSVVLSADCSTFTSTEFIRQPEGWVQLELDDAPRSIPFSRLPRPYWAYTDALFKEFGCSTLAGLRVVIKGH